MKKFGAGKPLSILLAATLMMPPQSAGYIAAGTKEAKKEAEISYAFTAQTILAQEDASGDAVMQIRIDKSGDTSKPSNMVLISSDVNADYGVDYTLTYDGKTLPKADSVTSMYAAFKENGIVSDYENDNNAFLSALLSNSGYALERENELVPISEAQKEGSAADENIASGLTDADEEGANFYDSLSTLEKIGAASTRTAISFAAGEKTKEVTLTVKADGLEEYDESFFLSLVSPKTDQYLQKKVEGIPDIPLKQGRDLAVTSVTIADASQKDPVCSVCAEKENYTLKDGEDTVTASFERNGAVDTFSTVLLEKDGDAYGYFYFTPYQKVQQAKLKAGEYKIVAKEHCSISGSGTISVAAKKALSAKNNPSKKGAADLDTIYPYDALPDTGKDSGQAKSKLAAYKLTALSSNGNPDWFPDWADNSKVKETDDYIAYTKAGSSLFRRDYGEGYCDFSYIDDKNRSFHGKNVYNTFRLNTSGTFSGLKTNIARAVTGYSKMDASWHTTYYSTSYDMTGIDSVEACYYVDDTDLNITLGVNGLKENKEFIKSKGIHSIKVDIPNDRKNRTVFFQNDNGGHHDGADVYLANAFKFHKRVYQVALTNSNKLDFVTKSGDVEQVAAEAVNKDRYTYLTMGDNHKIAMNLNMYGTYPMAFTGYQLLDKYGNAVEGTQVKSNSDQIVFNKDFLQQNEKYSYSAKREDRNEDYTTFQIQPMVSKIPIQQFEIQNGSRDSVYNPYLGELVLQNKTKDLYQGDHVILSARDIQEGYTFSGVYIRRRKSESSDWQSIMHYADSSGRVVFRLDADYSHYQLEPVFSGHEADTVTVTYADGAREHGDLTADGKNSASIILVNSEEYQINAYVPLVAKPDDGYLTCWYSGNRVYYGNTFYYQMDGNGKHNEIVVDFIEKSDIKTTSMSLDLSVTENQVNLRNSSAFADTLPLAGMDYVTTAGETYKGTTDQNGNARIDHFEGVVGGTYSMLLYKNGENRYRYVEYKFTGNRACNINVPAFSGMAAYPDRVVARIDGTNADQAYVDVTKTGEVEITVEVFRPDPDTKLGPVGLSFYYEGKDGMAKQDYTIDQPDQASSDEAALGVYDTYTLKVPSAEIPDLSYLYVDVKSSYQVLETQESKEGVPPSSSKLTVECDTGYVNTGYKFKTPNENSELAILEEVPELPGITSTGQDVSIPFIGSLDFGFTASNGAYFVRKDDPNTGTWYLLAGYNVTSTWPKTMTDRATGAKMTADALDAAQKQSKAAGDLNGGSSNLVKIPGKSVINIAPALSLKLVMRDAADGGYEMVGFDSIIGLDELIVYNAPFSIYGVPCYVNVTFNGEQFLEIHAGGDHFADKGVQNAVLNPQKDTDVTVFLQAPNLDLTVKTGVGFNAFAGIYLSLGGNLKFNIERTDKWDCGGYFYIEGGVGADLAVFSIKESIQIPGSNNREFGDEKARREIHSATAPLSGSTDTVLKSASAESITDRMNNQMEAIDKNPQFTLSRNQGATHTASAKTGGGEPDAVLNPADKNADIKLIKLSGKKLMAVTLADNGALQGSANYLEAVYAISEDGGKTWGSRQKVSESSLLQWHVNSFQLKDKILMTWSEGDLDKAVGRHDAGSQYDLASVAKALGAFGLKGRYFDLDGKPLGDTFSIAADDTAAINALDAAENADGTVDVFYERRAYDPNAASLTELMTQEQTICKAVLNSQGRMDMEDTRFLVQSKDGNHNYRVTELKAFSYQGIDGQIVVLDADGKLLRETAQGKEASIDDRQIYLRVASDANGNIPEGTLVPLTEAGTCAQHISLAENNGHMYLFYNREGSVVAMSDFLPVTAEEYAQWSQYSENYGNYLLIPDSDAMTPDTDFKVAMNADGKGILLWKNTGGQQGGGTGVVGLYAGKFQTDGDGTVTASGGPVLLNSLESEIGSPDIQILDDGTMVYGHSQLDGASMYESSHADAVVQNVEETAEVQVADADGEDYPLPSQEYTSYITLWNNGLADADNLTITASGALNGTASLADLIRTGDEGEKADGTILAGQMQQVMFPVTAADSFQDGDKVLYSVSKDGTVLSTFTDTVKMGAYIVPQEMADVIPIPGTDDYQISMTVTNHGNKEGSTNVHSYTFDQGVSKKNAANAKEYDYKDESILQPGDCTVVSYIMENAAYHDDDMHMIGIQTGDGFGQVVEGMLPARVESINQTENTAEIPKKGDILTLGTKASKAKYKVTSENTVSYYRSKVPANVTKANVPDTVNISGKTYQVTAIASKAFQGNKKLKEITVGKNVTKIRTKAFSGSSKLVTLTFKTTKLKTIGQQAFLGCKKLKAFTLKSSKLSKKAVKDSLKGSNVVQIRTSPSLRKDYQKYFTKKNAGRSVTIITKKGVYYAK